MHNKLVNGEFAFIPGYLKENPDSDLALFLINSFIIGPALNKEIHQPFYDLLSERNKNTPEGKDLNRRLNNQKVYIKKDAPNIIQKDSIGKVLKLSDYLGKYVLVEFWASWCSPCRAENPHLVKLYERFRNKDFEIFGISLDENRTRWLNAINKDKLVWPNVAEFLNLEKNPAAKAYEVTAIPHNVLIDPEGRIIERNLNGTALEKKLEELLGKN